MKGTFKPVKPINPPIQVTITMTAEEWAMVREMSGRNRSMAYAVANDKCVDKYSNTLDNLLSAIWYANESKD